MRRWRDRNRSGAETAPREMASFFHASECVNSFYWQIQSARQNCEQLPDQRVRCSGRGRGDLCAQSDLAEMLDVSLARRRPDERSAL